MNAMDIYDFDDAAPSPKPGTTGAAASSSDGTTADKVTTSAAPEQPSLNEEVQQALGSLGSWWGGFRKQGVVALASARKDLGQVVQQAQREIGKLATQPTSPTTSPRASTSTSEPNAAGPASKATTESEETSENTAGTTATSAEMAGSEDPDSTTTTERSTSPTRSASNPLFSFLPANIAQNLTSAPKTIQTTLQRTLATPEVQNLRSSISTNLTTLQSTVQSSITTAQSTVQSGVQSVQSNPQVQNLASSVQHLPSTVGNTVGNLNVGSTLDSVDRFVYEKGEEFWKGAGEFFREAVKIVPPSEEELAERERSMGGMGMGVGGLDAGVWGFDDLGGNVDGEPTGEKGSVEEAMRNAEAAAAGAIVGAGVAVSRTAALLKQLRGDPDLLRVDPLQGGEEGKGAETFEWFLKELEEKGASVGSEAWLAKCQGEEGLFEELRVTKEVLVPAEMDESTFWKRYWFRAWQIREAEEKRKALLQATATLQKEEDFAWEDEEDDTTGGADRTETQTPMDQSTLTPTLGVTVPEPASAEMKPTDSSGSGSGEKKSSGLGAGASGSPRESSEDSYDLVSTRSGNASGTALAVPALASVLEGKEEKSKKPAKKEGEEEDSGDSDWE